MQRVGSALALAVLIIGMRIITAEHDSHHSRRAIVIGATGATGREVVKALLIRDWNVTTLSRSDPYTSFNIGDKMKNLKVVKSNFDDIDNQIEVWKDHGALFICIGTTRGQAGSAKAFVDVEVGITEKAVNAAKKARILHASVVTSQGANRDLYVPTTLIHPLLYVRTMGEKQQAVIDAKFPSTTVFQPGMLDRLMGDRMAENVITAILPSLTLRVDILAQAMVQDAERKLDALEGSGTDSDGHQKCGDDIVTYMTGNLEISRSVDS